jgi:preprotein translocase subunit Sss1
MSNQPLAPSRNPASLLALVVGVVFLLVGILGFIPGVTTDYDTMGFAGHDSMAKLFGLFMVSVLHNIVHLLFGVAGIALARTARTAAGYLVVGGVVYLVLWIYGMVIDLNSQANFVPFNTPDNWLHLGLGVGMIALGVVAYRALRAGTTTTAGATDLPRRTA